jgi:predicted glycogen debranching enzyme
MENTVEREWLVTNGLGGYAAGTVANVLTRRYHGLLVAALPAPFGRMMMLSHISEQLRLENGRTFRFGGLEYVSGEIRESGIEHLVEFRLEGGLPVWCFEVEEHVIEKRVVLPYEQNSVHVVYRLLSGGKVRLKLRPALHIRGQEEPVNQSHEEPAHINVVQDRYEIIAPIPGLPPLRMYLHGEDRALTIDPRYLRGVLYRVEKRRGYQDAGELWSPGYFRATLSREDPVSVVGSTENWDVILALSSEEAIEAATERAGRLLQAASAQNKDTMVRELVLAADQFIITPVTRAEEKPRARAAGDEVRTIIAGYHWFTDWGRDTMISLEGLTLLTGRVPEAGAIIRTFGRHLEYGLLPNLFPEGQREGLYHTADATLWFFEAIHRYLSHSSDWDTLFFLLPKLVEVYQAHLRGTRFGIGVDPEDALLRQGADGYALTWMDAKMGDWVVTPRRGKAVEINALWYNALCLLCGWLDQNEQRDLAAQVRSQAARVRQSFNRRFWCEERSHLYDVIDGPDGNDAACRPNQILAIALPHAVLEAERWPPVFRTVREKLLTPVGLRTLSSDHPEYQATYDGDLRTRDGAYHQGTVWPWLIGPFTDAMLKVAPDNVMSLKEVFDGLESHLDDACIGSISEIFDGDAPYHPRGCAAQAWSVAETMRAYLRLSQHLAEMKSPAETAPGEVFQKG